MYIPLDNVLSFDKYNTHILYIELANIADKKALEQCGISASTKYQILGFIRRNVEYKVKTYQCSYPKQ